MTFKAFVGIDVSKSYLDLYIYSKKVHSRFENNKNGFQKMIEWLSWQLDEVNKALFAFENTGIYSLALSLFLSENQYKFTVISGLELKRSLGLRRGKSDDMDARNIAEYAYEKREKIKLYKVPGKNLLTLKRLLSYRERLVKERSAFQARFKEYKLFLDEKENSVLFDSHQAMICQLQNEINKINAELYRLVKEDSQAHRQYQLINSIKGLGPQTALMLIVLTNGFTTFDDWRKFASYSGIAPFPNKSGTFVGRTKVSHLANKRMKALLTCCATSAMQYNAEMRIYYQKRIEEGKNKMSTLNIIRNKLLARAFAVVHRGTPYVDTFGFAA